MRRFIGRDGGAGMWAQGLYHQMIAMPHATTATTPGIPSESHGHFYVGDGRVICRALSEKLPQGLEGVLFEAGLTLEDIDLAFVHQPSKPPFGAASQATGLPRGKLVRDYHRYLK